MSPSPAERFSMLLAASSENGWSPAGSAPHSGGRGSLRLDAAGEWAEQAGRRTLRAADGGASEFADGGETEADREEAASWEEAAGWEDAVGWEEAEDRGDAEGSQPQGRSLRLSLPVVLSVLALAAAGLVVWVFLPALRPGGEVEEVSGAEWSGESWEQHPDGAPQSTAGAGAPPGHGAAGANAAESTDPASGQAPVGPVIVHVVGAVTQPGIVELAPGARIADAIEAAGGAAADSEPTALNLARRAEDGEQVRVPTAAEAREWADAESGAGSAQGGSGGGDATGQGANGQGANGQGGLGGPGAADHAADGGLISLNTADLTQLQTLSGVGPVTAQAIIDHREAHGPFTSVEQLIDVHGIGEATLGRLRDHVTL